MLRELLRFIKVRFTGRSSRILGGQKEVHLLLAIIKGQLEVRNNPLPNTILLVPSLESHTNPDNQTSVLFSSSPRIKLFLLRTGL